VRWENRKVLVLGLGDTGLSMARWLARHGARVSVADTRDEPPGARALHAEHPQVGVETGAYRARSFDAVDAIAISPGVDRREPLVSQALLRGVPVAGDIELFAQALPDVAGARGSAMPKILAVTGSNGKSTVTAMAGAACRAAGCETLVAGNIGVPVLDALAGIESGAALPGVVVLELSSFQLESTSSLAADAATVLNVTEDHLDRYDTMADYAAAKARIFQGARVRVVNRMDACSVRMAGASGDVVSFGLDAPPRERDWGLIELAALARGGASLMPVAELPVAGLHNAANALAALALGEAIGLDTGPMLEGLRGFRGLPHRLEKVAGIGGITFFNDSKGTNVGATVAALNGMTTPAVLIAGGEGKGQNFAPLAAAVSARARAVVLIGRDAAAIERALEGCGVSLLRAQSMEAAVAAAYGAAAPGDAVLLSPACASYDMFRSYVHRGEVFVRAVQALAARESGP
jgi:UDP-N-acetylmuramoylalanine--D-glutamate ligase